MAEDFLVFERAYMIEALGSVLGVGLGRVLRLPALRSTWVHGTIGLRAMRATMVLIKISPKSGVRAFVVENLRREADVAVAMAMTIFMLQWLWYFGFAVALCFPSRFGLSMPHCVIDLFLCLLESLALVEQLVRRLERCKSSQATQQQEEVLLAMTHREFKVEAWSAMHCCVICLEDFRCNELASELRCGHVYHTECIRQWIFRGGTCALRCSPAAKLAMVAATAASAGRPAVIPAFPMDYRAPAAEP